MSYPFREAFQFYTQKIEYIFLFAFTIILPVLLFHAFIMNYVYAATPLINGTTSVADLFYGLFTIILLTVAQVPIIRFVYNEQEGIEHPVRNAFFHFALIGFSVFLFAVLYGILAVLGTMLFLIPGIVVMLFLFLTPYISAIDSKPARRSWKEALRLGKRHFFALLLMVLGISLAEMLIGIISEHVVFSITSSYGAQLFSQMMLNMLIFPFMIVVVTLYVMKWRDDSLRAEREK